MFARFDEKQAMTLRIIKETKRNAPVTHTLTDSYGEFRIKPQSSADK